MNNSPKKISIVEAIFMLMIVVPADLLEIAAPFVMAIPILGQLVWVAEHFVDWFVLLVIMFWLIMKKAKWGWSLAGNLIEYIPVLDILPFRTACLIATIILTNNSKIAKIASKVSSVTKPMAGQS